ncbi:MAG: HlyD family type I secretion periplasmic adaptor subunit [Pseudomonadota bacterium]
MFRHLKVFTHAWGDESNRRRKDKHRQRVETAFLPAALEIQDTPPSPIGRIILWLIIAAGLFALGWAILARVDVVAVAEGRLVPEGKLQSVEAAETGIVTGILVREGQRVEQGQPLITLDPTYAEADTSTAQSELNAAKLRRLRSQALLAFAEEEPFDPFLKEMAEGPAATAERRLAQTRMGELTASREALAARALAAKEASAQAETDIRRINATLPMVREQLTARRALIEDGYAAPLSMVELQERVTTLEFERQSQRLELKKRKAEQAMLHQEAAQTVGAFRAQAAAELSEAEEIIATRQDVLAKAERRAALQTLTAPVAGTVNEIALTTVGEVADPGTPLVTIVPAGNELLVHTFLLNKDAGFVTVGQDVAVKLEAYPFTRYGMLRGEILVISSDSVVDEARGLVYPARVRIVSNDIERNGQPARLAAGMAAIVEIKTGKRRVIDYLLSPIARATQEAGRER